MEHKIIIQAHISSPEEEIIGAKENIAEALELMGCTVDYINVMPGGRPMKEHDATEQAYLNGKRDGVMEFSAELLGKYCHYDEDGNGFVADTDIYNLARHMGVEE